jgi:hypothetical protein
MHRQINRLIHRSALALIIIHADNNSIEPLQRSKCPHLMIFSEPIPRMSLSNRFDGRDYHRESVLRFFSPPPPPAPAPVFFFFFFFFWSKHDRCVIKHAALLIWALLDSDEFVRGQPC